MKDKAITEGTTPPPRRCLLDVITNHGSAGNSNSTGAIEYTRFSDGNK